MNKIPSCPANLNQKVVKEMSKNGANNHLVCGYITDLANYCLDSVDDPKFTTQLPESETDSEKLTARLVMDYLINNKLFETLKIIEKEAKNDTFSDRNDASPDQLKFTKRYPPIMKLVRQRMNIPDEKGWYEIDSQVDTTIVGTDEDDVTFGGKQMMEKVQRLARERDQDLLIGYAKPQKKLTVDVEKRRKKVKSVAGRK